MSPSPSASRAIIDLSSLPPLLFLGEGPDRALDLARCGDRVQGLSDMVAASFPEATRIGIILRSGPELALAWLAVLHAGKVPCILNYPTEKLHLDYWLASMENTLAVCGIQGILHGPDLDGHRPGSLGPCLRMEDWGASAPARAPFPAEGSILQLSSGTTGFKKGILFSFEQLREHGARYNEVLRLGPGDRVASWLPLYHDMGFIACFVMPLLLGVPVVMMDPITWVKDPGRLFRAVSEHRATVCFMPNFGFELMARQPPQGPFPAMRHWISCSEPTYLETLQRFQRATGAADATLSTCYGMAENVFAVTQSLGLNLVEAEGRTHVSCGLPIPGTELKVVDGEIWVRSAHSLQSYLGGDTILDGDGFYASGDLGFLGEGGDLVITGRTRDLVNMGGRKFMLNDLDVQLAGLFPASAGRIASLAHYHEGLGTERVILLFEDERFWERNIQDSFEAIRRVTGLEVFEGHFVPPRFITKTSSGKINRRKTLEDWLSVCRARQATLAGERILGVQEDRDRLATDLRALLGAAPWDTPAVEVLDSLGLLTLRTACEACGVAYDPARTLDELAGKTPEESASGQVFSIIALVDGTKFDVQGENAWFSPDFLEDLERIVGCPVQVEHLVVPPTPILLSDLIYYDYFMPRRPGPEFSSIGGILEKIKGAGLILVDDEDNFRLGEFGTYPILSHQDQREILADFLILRYQPYCQKHHLLPVKVLLGADIRPDQINGSLLDLEAYLGVPVMRLAFHEAFRGFTKDWDFTQYREFLSDPDYVVNPVRAHPLRKAIADFLVSRVRRFRRSKGEPRNKVVSNQASTHFCCFLGNPEAAKWIVHHYPSFCILGPPASMPFFAKALDELGKPYRITNDPEDAEAFDCCVITGWAGNHGISRPWFAFASTGVDFARPHNVTPEIMRECPFLPLGVPEKLKENLPLEVLNRLSLGNYILNGGIEHLVFEMDGHRLAVQANITGILGVDLIR